MDASPVAIVAPVFGMVLCGFAAGRARWIGAQHCEGLNRFVYYLAFPALLFSVIAGSDKEELVKGGFLAAWTTCVVVGYLVTALLSRALQSDGWGAMGVRSMNVTCGNTALIGIPLAVAAFGRDAALLAVLATTVLAIVNVSLTLICIEFERGRNDARGRLPWRLAQALGTNPLLIAVAAGVAWSLWIGRPPQAMSKLLQGLGAAAVPCSLVSVGAFISVQRNWWRQASMLPYMALKLAALPCLAWWLARHVFQLDTRSVALLTILAAMPPASTGFVIAQRYGILVDESAAMLVAGTVLSFATLSLWLGVLHV